MWQRPTYKWLLRVGLKLMIYASVLSCCYLHTFWNWTFEPVGFLCRHKPLPVNNSGIKVLLYGMAKTGTTSMSRAMDKLYQQSWKADDVHIHMTTPLVDEYWGHPARGGGMFPWQRLAGAGAPAYSMGSAQMYSSQRHADVEAVQHTPRVAEIMAERFSKCRVDSLTFDGCEGLFWPIYEISPDAKVVMLNWRTHQEWYKSHDKFMYYLDKFYSAVGVGIMGTSMFPYDAVVLPVVDALTGNALLHYAGNGTASWVRESTLHNCWRQAMYERRIHQRRKGGHAVLPQSEEEYKNYWEEAKRRIPKERLLEFDIKKNTMKDLCKFLQIADNTACDSGRIPNEEVLIAKSEREHPEQFLFLVPYWLFCHGVNYMVMFLALAWPLDMVVATLCKLFPPKHRHNLT
mmetsp:Transcript_19707/g.40101  ORF Transcript_19707/g.40101 Transcript_19707/m.40101 type:complete len:402 (+) Transcript_19707:134-1339(+)